jgi:hypothetical protein
MKPELHAEGGITQIALQNAELLRQALGSPIRLELHMDPDGGEWYRTRVMYDTGDSHTFTGFGWGYSGEGPRGLANFCQQNDIPLTLSDIENIDNTSTAMVYSWPNSPMASRKVG